MTPANTNAIINAIEARIRVKTNPCKVNFRLLLAIYNYFLLNFTYFHQAGDLFSGEKIELPFPVIGVSAQSSVL